MTTATAPAVTFRPHTSRQGQRGYHVYADGKFVGYVTRVHDGRWIWQASRYSVTSGRTEYAYGDTRAEAAASLVTGALS